MQVIFFLVAVGILVAGGFLAAFIWSVKSGQYDDDYTPSVRILFDNYSSEKQSEQEEKEDNADENEENSEEAQSKQSNNNKT